MIYDGLQLASLTLLLLGIAISIVGTYYLTHLYHSYDALGFFMDIARACLLIVVFRWKTLFREARVAADVVPDAERRGRSLVGVYLIFLGFVLQGIGTALAVADILLEMQSKAV